MMFEPSNLTASMWELYRAAFKEGDEVVIISSFDEYYWGKLETRGDAGCTLHRPGRKSLDLPWDEIAFMSHDGFPIRKLRGADGSALADKLDTKDTEKALRHALERSPCSHCKRLVPTAELEFAKSYFDKAWAIRSEYNAIKRKEIARGSMDWFADAAARCGTDDQPGATRVPEHDMPNYEKGARVCKKCQKKLIKISTRWGDPWETGEAEAVLFNAGNKGPDYWGEDDEEALILIAPDGAIGHLFNLPRIFDLEAA